MRKHALLILAAAAMVLAPSQALAQYARADWQAELSTLAHGVSGTVTIVDEDTYRVDNFNYDGAGISVYFYLATEQTYDAFDNGLSTGPQLVNGVGYVDETFVIDLPSGNFDPWSAISVWCVPAGASFGEGTFAPLSPYLPGDGNGDLVVDDADYTIWADNYGQANATWQMGDWNADDVVDDADYTIWADNYGDIGVVTPAPPALAALAVGALAVLRRT